MKLHPTLPRKQLDIPRFSPTAAWRLLSALESPVHSEDDDLMLIEEQIPHPHAGHQLTDKSGDSGISGDASPQHQDSAHNSQVSFRNKINKFMRKIRNIYLTVICHKLNHQLVYLFLM